MTTAAGGGGGRGADDAARTSAGRTERERRPCVRAVAGGRRQLAGEPGGSRTQPAGTETPPAGARGGQRAPPLAARQTHRHCPTWTQPPAECRPGLTGVALARVGSASHMDGLAAGPPAVRIMCQTDTPVHPLGACRQAHWLSVGCAERRPIRFPRRTPPCLRTTLMRVPLRPSGGLAGQFTSPAGRRAALTCLMEVFTRRPAGRLTRGRHNRRQAIRGSPSDGRLSPPAALLN